MQMQSFTIQLSDSASAVVKQIVGVWEKGQEIGHKTIISGVSDFLIKMPSVF